MLNFSQSQSLSRIGAMRFACCRPALGCELRLLKTRMSIGRWIKIVSDTLYSGLVKNDSLRENNSMLTPFAYD
jgi:hypothetical protein